MAKPKKLGPIYALFGLGVLALIAGLLYWMSGEPDRRIWFMLGVATLFIVVAFVALIAARKRPNGPS